MFASNRGGDKVLTRRQHEKFICLLSLVDINKKKSNSTARRPALGGCDNLNCINLVPILGPSLTVYMFQTVIFQVPRAIPARGRPHSLTIERGSV